MSRKQKLKARDRITQKMSRDGVIERNETAGEDIRISKREVRQDLRGSKTDSGTFYQLDKRPGDKQLKKHKQHRPAEQVKDVEKTAVTNDGPQPTGMIPDKQPEIPSNDVQSEALERDVIRQEPPIQVSKSTPVNNRHIPLQSPLAKAKPPPVIGETPIITEQTAPSAPQTKKPIDAPRSVLNHDDGGKLQFEHGEKPAQSGQRKQKPPQKYKPEVTEQSDNAATGSLPPTERISDTAQSHETSDTPPSALKHDAPDNLHFEPHSTEVKPPGKKPLIQPKGRPVPNQATKQTTNSTSAPVATPPFIAPKTEKAEVTAEPPKPLQTNETADTSLHTDKADAPLKHDKSGKLQFEPDTKEIPQPIKPKHKPVQSKAAQPYTKTKPTDAPNSDKRYDAPVSSDEQAKPPYKRESADTSDAPQQSDNSTDSPLHSEKTDTPLHEDKTDTPLKSDKPGKLQFSDDESAPAKPTRSAVKQQKRYGKAQKQTDKAVNKLDTAKSKLPAKKKLRSERVFNEESGKVKRKLYFESQVKSQGEHLKGALPLRPVKAAGNSALAFGHRKMYQVEHENVATEAAHKVEMSAEGGVRAVLRHHKTAPYRKVARLESKVQKKAVNSAYHKALAENPKLKSNVISRAFQKRKIKKDYAKAAREAQKAAKRAKKAGSAVSSAAKAVAGVIKRHPVATAVVILVLLLLFCLMSLIGAFGSAGSGGVGAILTASYLAEDVDIDNAEVAYTEWEVDLQQQIANSESTHPGYDEYRYNIGDISHNPYELMAYLTVKYQNFTYAAIESDLRGVFGEQYSLTLTPSVETRYADPTDANEDGDYEPYEWKVLTISLTARSFTDVASSRLSGDELVHYALLLQTKGSRQYVSNPFGIDWLPYVTSYYGYRVHPISGVKDLHRGVDIGFPAGTQILSAQNGTVTFAGYSGDYGNVVVIENADGFVTKYAHCETLLVSANQTVSMGDVIATVGNTGSSTGPHLHFEVLKNGIYLNPIYFADTGSFNLNLNYGYAGAPMGDGSYAALITEADKYLNFPYVWGGSSPATSFDCSGFVSWVLTQSGVKNTGRLGAQGLFNICNPVSPTEARPGDLIFFTGTYSAPLPVTHVGIYVGTDATGRPRMLHCGNPIQYTYIDTAYWQSHFYAYGRV